jgi:O-antigen ligase
MELFKFRNIYTSLLATLTVIMWITGRWTEVHQMTTFYIELIIVTVYISRLPINHLILSTARQHKPFLILLLVFIVFYMKMILILRTETLLYVLILIYSLFFINFSNYFKQPHVLFISCFLSLISISFFFSPLELSGHYLAQHRYEQTILHAIVFLVLIEEFRNKALNPNIMLSTIIISIFFIILAYFFYYFTASPPPTDNQWWRHPPCCFYHPRHFGYTATAATAVLLGFIASLKLPFKGPAILLWLLLTLSLTTLIWLGGRASTGSIILTMLALSTLVVLYGQKTQKAPIIIGFIGSLLISIGISELISVFPWNGIMTMLGRTASAENLDSISSGRLQIWKEALQAWKQSPLLGLGSNAFAYIPRSSHFASQPHSMIVQFLLEYGVFGIVLLILIYAMFVKQVFLRLSYGFTNMPPSVLAAVSSILALGIHGLVDGTLFYPQPVFVQVICFSILLSFSKQCTQKADDKSPSI